METIKQSSKNWQATFDAIKDPIFLLDPNGIIIQANKASHYIFNKQEKILGRHCYDVVHNMEDPVEGCPLVRMKSSNKRESLVLPVDDNWFEVVADPILNDNNELTGIVHIIYDITERKKAELLIQQQNEQLQKLNDDKDKFFSIIAHDLKSPFQGFLSLTQMLTEGIDTIPADDLSQLGREMHKTAINLFTLLKNLLEWEQMQKGTINYAPEELSLTDLIAENVKLLMERGKQKGINIVNTVSNPIFANIDGKMISSVFLNLLSNAIKFTNRGGTVTIKIIKTEDNFLKVSIIDTGIGMGNSFVDKLFRIGEKTKRTGTDGELSTGLGLMLCKEFIEMHGGKIWVESKEGTGSTFYFTVPCDPKRI